MLIGALYVFSITQTNKQICDVSKVFIPETYYYKQLYYSLQHIEQANRSLPYIRKQLNNNHLQIDISNLRSSISSIQSVMYDIVSTFEAEKLNCLAENNKTLK
jgi:hypothetical protein